MPARPASPNTAARLVFLPPCPFSGLDPPVYWHSRSQVLHVKQYMKEQKLTKAMQTKVLWYYEHYLARKSAFDEGLILSEISIDLRQKVVLMNNAKGGMKMDRTRG